jgi:hypothetical protein
MSYEWQSLRRCSLLGPKSGLSLSQSQQILQMHGLQQKSRRFSLNANSVLSANTLNTGLTSDLTPIDSRSQFSNNCLTQQHISSSNCSNDSVNTLKLSEGQTQNQCISSIDNIKSVVNINNVNPNSNASTSGTNSGLCGVTQSTGTGMMPIINFENVATSRPSIEMNGRVSRRSSKSAQDSFTCSQQSILSAMDRFVKAVNNMDSTVLVPSKLRDMDMPSAKMVRIPPALANTDLHSFFLMLNDVKKELLWGPGTQQNTTSLMPLSGRSSPRDLKHIRQPSDDSLGSLGSTASSSSDQDTDSEADSLMTDRDSVDEHTSHLAAAFRHHLQGLHTILHQLADSADYLSSRYQEDIDASSL